MDLSRMSGSRRPTDDERQFGQIHGPSSSTGFSLDNNEGSLLAKSSGDDGGLLDCQQLNVRLKPKPSHPTHLKGREIGLWYARKAAIKRDKNEMLVMAEQKVQQPKKEPVKYNIKLSIDGITQVERQYQNIEEKTPLPNENINARAMQNTELNIKDYNKS